MLVVLSIPVEWKNNNSIEMWRKFMKGLKDRPNIKQFITEIKRPQDTDDDTWKILFQIPKTTSEEVEYYEE